MNPQNNRIFCTLFDSNYLDKGLALYHSMRKHIRGFRLYIFAFDNRCFKILNDMRLKNVILVPLKEIMNPQLQEKKEERSSAEFCWTCTAVIIEHVLIKYKEKVCTYIDADIYFFANPENAIQEIANHGCSVGVAPHRFERCYWDVEQKLNNGKYCVHFNTFFYNEDGLSVLREWKEDCLDWCYSRCEDGKLGDQKYTDRWKMKYSCIHEAENLGVGVAPWNLHLYAYKGKKDGKLQLRYRSNEFNLIFYHFEGLKYLDDGRVFLNLWKYGTPGLGKKVRAIYGEYFIRIKEIRQYLENNYGVSFDHMRADHKNFLKIKCSLNQALREKGLLGGLKEWIRFKSNNIMWER